MGDRGAALTTHRCRAMARPPGSAPFSYEQPVLNSYVSAFIGLYFFRIINRFFVCSPVASLFVYLTTSPVLGLGSSIGRKEQLPGT